MKKIFLYLCSVLVLISFVSADIRTDIEDSLEINLKYYSSTGNYTNTLNDSINFIKSGGGNSYNCSSSLPSNDTLDTCYHWDRGTSTYFESETNDYLSGMNEGCIEIIVNSSSYVSSYFTLASYYYDDTNRFYFFAYDRGSTGDLNYLMNDGGVLDYHVDTEVDDYTPDTLLVNSEFQHIVIGNDGTNETWWLNNVEYGHSEATNGNWFQDLRSGQVMYIGARKYSGSVGQYHEGTFLYYRIYSDSDVCFNQTKRDWLYNSKSFRCLINCTGGVAPPPTASLSIYKGLPTENSQYISGQNFWFNGTATNTQENNFNCTFYVNGTQYANKTNINISTNNNFTYSLNTFQNTFNVSCENNNASDSVRWDNITIDLIEPYQNITYPTDSLNLDYQTDFSHNITFNDSNFDGYNISYYFNNSGTLILQQEFYEDNMLGGQYNITNTTNSSNWCSSPPCSIYMNVTSWDSHNPVEEPHEKYKELFNEDGVLTFFFEDGYITLKSNKTENYLVVSEDNRYKIEFGFSQKKDIDLLLESDRPFYFKETEYNGHFVFPMFKYFDLEDEEHSISITSITKTENGYLIIFDSDKLKVKTKSLGDLHIRSEVVQFILYESPSLNTQLLTDLNTSVTGLVTISDSIEGGIGMIAVVILLVVFLILGVFTPIRLFMSFSGIIMFILSIMTGEDFLNGTVESLSAKAMFFVFLFTSIGLLLMGVILQIIQHIEGKKKRMTKDFYSNIY